MTCQRCHRDATVTVDCRDRAGAWRLCSPCWREITADNAALRTSSMVDDVAAPASLASSAHSSNAGPSPAVNVRRPRAAQTAPRGGSTSGDVAPRAAVPATLELTAPSAAVRP